MKIFDLRSPTFSGSFECGSPVNSVSHHPVRNEIVSGDSGGSVKVWDLNAGKCRNEIRPDHHNVSNSNNNSQEKQPPVNVQPNTIHSMLSSTSSGRETVSIQSVDISEDGRTCIAANNHGTVFIWDPSDSRNFRPLSKFRAHATGTYLLQAKISPDGRQLVTCSSDQTAKIFDITRNDDVDANGKPVPFTPTLSLTLAQHNKWVWDAVFSADSSYLVTASSDHVARLFNLRTGEVVRKYEGHQYAVTCVALNDSST